MEYDIHEHTIQCNIKQAYKQGDHKDAATKTHMHVRTYRKMFSAAYMDTIIQLPMHYSGAMGQYWQIHRTSTDYTTSHRQKRGHRFHLLCDM